MIWTDHQDIVPGKGEGKSFLWRATLTFQGKTYKNAVPGVSKKVHSLNPPQTSPAIVTLYSSLQSARLACASMALLDLDPISHEVMVQKTEEMKFELRRLRQVDSPNQPYPTLPTLPNPTCTECHRGAEGEEQDPSQ